MAHRAPVADIDADLVLQIIDVDVRHGVREVVSCFHRERIDRTVGDGRREPARSDRRRDEMNLHRVQLAGIVERAGQRVARRRTILVVRHVVFARPQQLHRLVRGLRAFHRGRNEVGLEPSAEAAAEERRVHEYFLRRQSCGLRGRRLHQLLNLRRRVDMAAVVAKLDGAVLRLQRRVREHGQLVGRLDAPAGPQPAVGVTFLAYLLALAGRSRSQAGADRCVRQLRVLARSPRDLQLVARLVRLPIRVRDHRDAGRRLQHVTHAGHSLRGFSLEALDAGAELGRLSQRRVQHARQAHVDTELRGAVHLRGRVQALLRLADVLELVASLELHVLGLRQRRRCFRELAERLAAAGEHDVAVRDRARLRRRAPLFRGCADESHARFRARHAQLLPRVAHTRAAARHLAAQQSVDVLLAGRSEFDFDGRRRDAELFGDQRRQRGVHALAHFGAIAQHR